MKRLAIVLLTATMALASGAVFAEGADSGSNNGSANQANAPGSIQKIAPNGVDNSKINNTDKPVNEVHKKKHKSTTGAHHKASKKTLDHKKAMCKDGRCPDQVPGTNQSKATGN
ncbi:protein YbgS [Rahnella sp. PCH160]|uniref:protein YbgS n=1 Tax=Rahnella sp. PCH160 TaxID=3447928 RepID=UPI0039FCBA52